MEPIIPDREGTVIHAIKVVQALAIVYVAFLALFVKWLSPSFLSLFASILLGVGLGIGYSFLHHKNKVDKKHLSDLVRAVICAAPLYTRSHAPVMLRSHQRYLHNSLDTRTCR